MPLLRGSRGDDSGEVGGGCDAARLRESVVQQGVAEGVCFVQCCCKGRRTGLGEELGGVAVRR